MNQFFTDVILKATGANSLQESELIQTLWSGYGHIRRISLSGGNYSSVVVKHVSMPKKHMNIRKTSSDLSHNRKLKSYEVETEWYRNYSEQCDDSCRIPKCLALETYEDEVLMVMEDLDEAGFDERRGQPSQVDIEAGLKWLANFHATFMGDAPDQLWNVGTYWHLETRPDELLELRDKQLIKAAPLIDKELSQAKYLSFVHGDAKLANFCFSSKPGEIAAVDFQYVGGGCGMKDVAYYFGSCLYEADCEKEEEQLLNIYFKELVSSLKIKKPTIDAKAVEAEWRELFPVAWADFHRFIKGWGYHQFDKNSYSERTTKKVIEALLEKQR